ncbi:MAG TPA: MBL fold metallo-hydrolase [Actinomycetes bacterium]
MRQRPVVPLVDAGLGNSAYLVDLGDGGALVVDASRDLRAVRAAAEKRGLRVRYAVDSHLHADFLSGARQLAVADGAVVLASAAGRREFPHTGLADGDEVDLGGLRLRAISTPGHTEEHLAFLLLDGDRPTGVFTGGSLIVGAAARTDLVDPARTADLARAQYRSLQRLITLPDAVEVFPTHGAGSFCSAPPGAERTSSIGMEKATNPLLQVADEDAFVSALLGSLGSFPPYFRRLAEENRRGPAVIDEGPALASVGAARVAQLLRDGALLVDTRPTAEFAAAHLPGSLSIPLRDAFATWLGWTVPHDLRLVVLRGDDQDPTEIAHQAAKIGYDNIVGELAGGIAAAITEGFPTKGTRLLRADDVAVGDARRLLDVRQRSEFAAGHLPGADNVELGDLAGYSPAPAPAGTTVVMCQHGERAMTGASLLERAGQRNVAVMVGGPEDWATVHGARLERGE